MSLLLLPFRVMLRFLQHPFLETDSFTQNVRKHMVTSSMLIWIANVFILAISTDDIAQRSVSLTLMRQGEMFFLLTYLLISYVIMWRRRHVSDTVAYYMFIGALLVILFQVIRDVNNDGAIFVTLVLVGSIVSHVPQMKTLCCIGLCIVALQYYNLNAVVTGHYPPLVPPTPYGTFSPCKLSDEIISFLLLSSTGSTLYLVYAQTRAFHRQMVMTESNLDLARQVAELLAKYNTENAAALLNDHNESSDLLDVFGVIVKNMEAYRPYLPNYLLRQQQQQIVESSSSSTPQSSPPSPWSVVRPSRRQSENIVVPMIESNPSLIEDDNPVGGHHLEEPSPPPTTTRSPKGVHQQHQHHFEESTCHQRPVTVAILAYRNLFEGNSTETESIRTSIVQFVERVHNTASLHTGAVHSFLGDDVVMSWNTITRCVDHYYRGSLTMLELLSDRTAPLYGAIVSGPARCQRGGIQTFAWTLHAPALFRELYAIQSIAQQSKSCIILTSRSHAQQIEHSATTHAVDAIRMTMNDGTIKLCIVHEIIGLHRRETNILGDGGGVVVDGAHNEWMYQIQHDGAGKSIQSQVTECVMKYVSASSSSSSPSYFDGLSTLEDLMKSLSADRITPGMVHLARRLQDCVNGNSVLPCVM